MINFDKIVNKLSKKEWKILTIYEIWSILDPDFRKLNEKNITSVYKLIYRLKACNMIIPIKNSIYFINNKKNHRNIDIIDNFYWKILKKIISEYCSNDFIIWNLKALELNLKDYSIPSEIIIYNKELNKSILLSQTNKIIFKKLSPWKKNLWVNIFTKFKTFTKKIKISWIIFTVADEELSILDSLLIRNNSEKINIYQVDKFLKKYSNFLSREKMWKLVSMKYITSINRLKELSKKYWYHSLYIDCLDIIKIEWWNCFLTQK